MRARRCSTEGARPPVDLEDAALVAQLLAAFHGAPPSPNGPGGADGGGGAQPASAALAARLMGLLARSVAAANAFPENLRTVFACVYGRGTTLRLKQAGMEFAVWVFRHARAAPLQAAAPAVLRVLLHLLDDSAPLPKTLFTPRCMCKSRLSPPCRSCHAVSHAWSACCVQAACLALPCADCDAACRHHTGSSAIFSGQSRPSTSQCEGRHCRHQSTHDAVGNLCCMRAVRAEAAAGTDAAAAALRGFTYQAVGQLAARAPAVVRGDPSVAARFFGALATEQAGVRAAVAESLSSLAAAYQGCTGARAQATLKFA